MGCICVVHTQTCLENSHTETSGLRLGAITVCVCVSYSYIYIYIYIYTYIHTYIHIGGLSMGAKTVLSSYSLVWRQMTVLR